MTPAEPSKQFLGEAADYLITIARFAYVSLIAVGSAHRFLLI
jgi:hypothetical protein